MSDYSPDKAMTVLAAIHKSVTRATGRPPKGPFRSKDVPGWSYYPDEGVVVRDEPEEAAP